VSLTRRLAVVLALNLALVTALVITGRAARSLAVLAAGADYLADAAAIGASLLAIWLARRPPSPAGGFTRACCTSPTDQASRPDSASSTEPSSGPLEPAPGEGSTVPAWGGNC
jgi:hypothetical protein